MSEAAAAAPAPAPLPPPPAPSAAVQAAAKKAAATQKAAPPPAPPVDIGALVNTKIAELEHSATKDHETSALREKVNSKQFAEMKAKIDGMTGGAEEKMKAMQASYAQLLLQYRRLESEISGAKARSEQAAKDHDSRLAKVSAAKGKLEALCRELQKQNKSVAEESHRVAAEEQQKRAELSKKFHDTIREITAKLEEQGEERLRQMREGEGLREKLRNFAEQYELREQHFNTQMRAKDLERQLLEAKLKQQTELTLQEGVKAQAYLDQVTAMAKAEAELRQQLAVYSEKFDMFQQTLSKSSTLFSTFKQEQKKAAKHIEKLDQENLEVRAKVAQADAALAKAVEERDAARAEAESLRASQKRLAELCRVLQFRCSSLLPPPGAPTTQPAAAAEPAGPQDPQSAQQPQAPAPVQSQAQPQQPTPHTQQQQPQTTAEAR